MFGTADVARARRGGFRLPDRTNAGERTAIFDDAASTAASTGFAYWLVLGLAGAIASLGLALNSSAVIIGAMLIAPLLAPVVGLGLALAVGDGRLAVETAFIVLLSTGVVIGVGALLALALPVPFQTVTTEIAARTRPTTLDLVIAVFSGLAGAAVTVARRSRLSGAVPGVAVAVALVPPLAVTGYGIGTGWNWTIIRGSLLLYGANLAGIVMSGMTVFLLAGMHHADVLRSVEEWHRRQTPNPLTSWIERIPGLRSLGILRATWARIILVVTFVAFVAIPLRETLRQIAREARVQHAVDAATQLFRKPGQSFVINRDVELGNGATRVVLNVATTGWFGDSARHEFERRASAAAGEPVSLVLDELPASGGDLSKLASLLSAARPTPTPTVSTTPSSPARSTQELRGAVRNAIDALTLPDSIAIIGFDLAIGDSAARTALRLAYAGPQTMGTQVEQILTRQLTRALSLPDLIVSASFVPTTARPLPLRKRDAIDSLAVTLERYPRIAVELIAGLGSRHAEVDSIATLLRRRASADSSRVSVIASSSQRGTLTRLFVR